LNILITGQNGYIARRLYAHLLAGRHDARLVDVRGDTWRHMDFNEFDSIVHLAGIVHNSSTDPADFRRVNVELTAALAQKARNENVPQFVFVSTMAVYGKDYVFKPLNEITAQTPPAPKTHYGKSKLSAETEVLKLYGDRACIIRPPTVYGENCTGNYRRLRSLVLKVKIAPKYENRRGMIYVHNLCELIKLLVENSGAGIFHPQDTDFLPTYELARLIGEKRGVKVFCLRAPFLKTAAKIMPDLKKAFGSLSYAPELTVCPYGEYRVFDTNAAVGQTERYWNS
jgi:UDP-glucose 4-epimerase